MSRSPSALLSPIDAVAQADAAGLVVHALAAQLPAESDAPSWVTLFPTVGKVETRDGRIYEVDPARIIATFRADGLELPVDVNHATDLAAWTGARADAVGWIKDLRLADGALQARVEWLDEGRALLAAKKYKYGSPSFMAAPAADGAPRPVERLRAWALVTAPALARQTALANLSPHPAKDPSMKTIAEALGLAGGATEADCLAALNERLTGSVARAVHERALADLTSATDRLSAIEGERRAEKVSRVLDDALAAKKLTPAERPAFEALCATDAGLSQVEALLKARPELLAASWLGNQPPPDGDQLVDLVTLSTQARKLVDEAAARGERLSATEAVERARRGRALAA
jgi:phage I-like protein